jgi:2-amino-4-hydroxy-6-hydroxymethyldihydropteridine diphosphokinase
MSEIVFLSLGSNLGDRAANLNMAKNLLSEIPELDFTAQSAVYNTKPIGCEPGCPDFLNSVLKFECRLNPSQLLDCTESIERKLGRRKKENNEPREIDIDIILFGDTIIKNNHLEIPHAGMSERAFVLMPLSEIAPDIVDPKTKIPISELLGKIGDQGVKIMKDKASE